MLAGDRPVKFEPLYRDRRVKRALKDLFHGKCAYCESPVQDFDVEHFRPKGRVANTPRGIPSGYYWLAYQWTNLYPACQFCNRERVDIGSHEDPLDGRAAGKGDQFPLAPSGRRANSPSDDLALEFPLLLDPCADDPEEHLLYGPLGDIDGVAESEKGDESVRAFHLKRSDLRKLRQIRLEEFLSVLKSGGDPALFIREQAPYAGLCRYVLKDPDAFGATM